MVSVVSYHPTKKEFTVEEAPAGSAEPELSLEALRLRVRQQELLADYGVLALKGTPFPELLDHAARLVAEGLQAEFAKVLKYLPEQNRLLVCAGVGWCDYRRRYCISFGLCIANGKTRHLESLGH